MSKLINLTGQRFGKWLVLEKTIITKTKSKWLCKCDCGVIKQVQSYNLRNGKSTNCGCLKLDTFKAVKTHGDTINRKPSKEYMIYSTMIQRCTNTNNKNYHNYGGRGITVCQRWLDGFEYFLEDMGRKPTPKHSLDRINNNLGYCKENCRWATSLEQMNNTRSNRLITYNGKTQTLTQWADETKVNMTTICHRLKLKLPLDLVFSKETLVKNTSTGHKHIQFTYGKYRVRVVKKRKTIFYAVSDTIDEAISIRDAYLNTVKQNSV